MCTHASSEWFNGLGIKVHTVNVIGVVDLPLSIGSANFPRTACNCLNQYRFHNRFVKITASSASLCHLWRRACRMRHSLAKPRFHRGHIPYYICQRAVTNQAQRQRIEKQAEKGVKTPSADYHALLTKSYSNRRGNESFTTSSMLYINASSKYIRN